jgi:transketolase
LLKDTLACFVMSEFPIDLAKYQKIGIDPWNTTTLSASQKAALQTNIELCRSAIVYFTSCGSASGVGGHTGGAFDTAVEVAILDAFFRGRPDKFVPIFFDEAGHRVATQYLMSALRGHLPAEQLSNYRQGHSQLPGHPELGMTPGVEFSSGRLGHMWPFVNGVAMANPDKIAIVLSSDGSQQEGDDAEAARFAVMKHLNVKVIVDDNDITIAGRPSEYMQGYSVTQTLRGHGLSVLPTNGEDLDAMYTSLRQAVTSDGPYAVVAHRTMAPGIPHVEGTTHGHDATPAKHAIAYLEARNQHAAASALKDRKKTPSDPHEYQGSGKMGSNRKIFGEHMCNILDRLSIDKRRNHLVIDADLMGSTGLDAVKERHPELFHFGGIMERGNFSAAAGFGFQEGKQGIFSSFAAFLEMLPSEITMARLNNANVLCHFSHSGVDDMSDNTCHFGMNHFFADNGLDDGYDTKLYVPADEGQVRACLDAIFFQPGLRFVFSTRSKTPEILKANGEPFFGSHYKFAPGKDDVIREGNDGYIVSFGDALYRSLDAVERLQAKGLSVGLINKHTLNVVDEQTLARVGCTRFVLVVEPQNTKTGLGVRFGTWLLEAGYNPRYSKIGIHREGCSGLWEQAYHQGYDSESIQKKALVEAGFSYTQSATSVTMGFVGSPPLAALATSKL